MQYHKSYEAPIGKITIFSDGKHINAVRFGAVKGGEETPLIAEAHKQLQEYFKGKRKDFDLPLKPLGTEFQKKVWKALQTIPYGETRSYKELAQAVGGANYCRAVGGANNKNPLAIIVPCHRVIGSNGELVGYAGGLKIKQKLLELEK